MAKHEQNETKLQKFFTVFSNVALFCMPNFDFAYPKTPQIKYHNTPWNKP